MTITSAALLLVGLTTVGCQRRETVNGTADNESVSARFMSRPAVTVSEAQSIQTGNAGLPKSVNPLTKISPAELKKIKQFALTYYKFRVCQTAHFTRNLLNSGVLKPFLAPTFDNSPAAQTWYMDVVANQFSVEKVELYENVTIGFIGNTGVQGDWYNVTIRDNQVGNVFKGRFFENPKSRFDVIAVVMTKSGYKVETDRDLGTIDVLQQGNGYSRGYYSGLVVFEKDLPTFLENIKPWYKDIPEEELLIPTELKNKISKEPPPPAVGF